MAGIGAEPGCGPVFFCSTVHDCAVQGRERFHSSRSKGETASEEEWGGGPGRAKCQVMKNIAEARP